jgi:CBS domain-containing protein
VGGQLHLGRLFGIPIVAGISWLIWLFVMLLVLQGFFPEEIAGSDGRAFALALAVVAIYVVALLGHEFGHALMARALGIETERRAPTKSIVRADGVMDAQPVWVGATETAAEAQEHAFRGDAPDWVVVLEPDGRLRGIVTAARVAEELQAGRPDTPVQALLAPGGRASTREDVLLHRLRKDRDLERLGGLPVVDVDGLLVGVVSAEAVRQALVVEGGLRT